MSVMRVISLQSGSNGNCFYVEAGDRRLLFDAGISGRQAELRLAEHGRDIRDVDALFISHDHRDHSASLGIFQRKFGVPVVVTEPTLEAAGRYKSLGKLDDVTFFQAGQCLASNGVRIETIPTPHDGVDGVGFVIDDGDSRLGILTDLGHMFDELIDVVRSLDAVVLESNYDPQMLARGSYPEFLQARIRGDGGHLSNEEAAMVLGAARVLKKISNRLNGNIKFVFQPAEEGPGGAKPMIDAGVMENPEVDYALGCHVWPSIPEGDIGIKPGSLWQP